ncbi:hypothetical protein MMC11_005376 [Xylographa trunciseda]|nr:hypothetical protein [Xylographa trunciseda]
MSNFPDSLEQFQPTPSVETPDSNADLYQLPALNDYEPNLRNASELRPSLESFPGVIRSFNVSSGRKFALHATSSLSSLTAKVYIQGSLRQVAFVPLYMVVRSGIAVGVPGTEDFPLMPHSITGSSTGYPGLLMSVPPDPLWTMGQNSHEDTNIWNTTYSVPAVIDNSSSGNLISPPGTESSQAPFFCICGGLPHTNPMAGPFSNHQTYDGFTDPQFQTEIPQQHQPLSNAGTTSPWNANNGGPVSEVTDYTSPYADLNVVNNSTSSSSSMTTDYTLASGPLWQE